MTKKAPGNRIPFQGPTIGDQLYRQFLDRKIWELSEYNKHLIAKGELPLIAPTFRTSSQALVWLRENIPTEFSESLG